MELIGVPNLKWNIHGEDHGEYHVEYQRKKNIGITLGFFWETGNVSIFNFCVKQYSSYLSFNEPCSLVPGEDSKSSQ